MTGFARNIASASRSHFFGDGRSTAMARQAMAATSHPLATWTALDTLKAGGNAVDAAIAASAVLAVVEPHMTGIGGDCFAIVAKPDSTLFGINGSGPSPAALTLDHVLATGVSEIEDHSPHAVTVPGAVRTWDTLLTEHGTKTFDALLRPAIELATNGYVVTPRVAHDWATSEAELAGKAHAARHLLLNGKAPKAGEVMAHPALGDTLKTLSAKGADAFYTGQIAEEIVETLAQHGGVMAETDLANFAPLTVEPIYTDYRGLTIAELPPNGQGVIALLILNILERFDHSKLDPFGAERFHLQMEAGRLAYAIRDQFIADPESLPVSVDALLDKTFSAGLAAKIDPNQRIDVADTKLPPHSDTVYLTVVDKDGLSVSFINSLFADFGSQIVTPRSGITLHCRGSGFSLDPHAPNALGPKKRPLHTIIPAFALDEGQPILPFGVMGGAYQAVGHAHFISNLVDFGLDLQGALSAPRCFWNTIPGALKAEPSLSEDTRGGLRARGHQVEIADKGIGGGQAILIDRDKGVLHGASDPRKDGLAFGY